MNARTILFGMSILFLAAGLAFSQEDTDKENPVVLMKTNKGDIKIELWPNEAPKTVENFLRYVDEKFYDGTVFHRVIADFMIQGGGFTEDMKEKETHDPIPNEAKADVSNKRGTIAMARLSDLDSATSQFFINLKDNPLLDHRDDTARGYGYCVFGRVIEGLDVMDKIGKARTGIKGRYEDVPVDPIVIESVRRVEKKEKKDE